MEPAIQFGLNAPFLGGLFSIILIDVLLSGDNSIVIALAVQTLPAEKRRMGLLAGAGAAALMRIAFTVIASRLMNVPYIKLVGGLLILWIAYKLLAENEDADPKHKQARSLFHAIWIITVADVTMSLDNVLAVAGASKGSLLLLWFGLGLSIPLVIFASTLLSNLMERFPVIVIAGAAVLGKVGMDLVFGDPVVTKHVTFIPHLHWVSAILGIGFILGCAAWIKFRKNKTSAD